MKKPLTYRLFLLGSIILILITAIYYAAIPSHDYFGDGFTSDPPGESLPVQVSGDYVVSNLYLLKRLIAFLIGYLVTFDALYLLLWKPGGMQISRPFVLAHLFIIVLGSCLLIYFNPFVLAYAGELSDSISVELLPIREDNERLLWYNAITTRTSIMGILMFLSGSIIFLIGAIRASKRRSYATTKSDSLK